MSTPGSQTQPPPGEVDLRDLLPHRCPMLLLDRLVSVDGDVAEAAKTFQEGEYGTIDNTVSEPVLVECMAQTVAAMKGYTARTSGAAPRPGMLVGVDGVDFGGRPPCGQELRVSVRLLAEMGPFSLAEGEVRCASGIVASGKLKFYEEETSGAATA